MSEFTAMLKNEFRDFPAQVMQRIQDGRRAEIEFACSEERENNIVLAAMAMLDAGLSSDTVKQMLQKHWDLRQSEANNFITYSQKRLAQVNAN